MDAIEIAVPLTASSGEGEPERLRRGSPEYAAHQKYLARVIDKVGRLTLANIHPSAADARGPKLEEVYVDLPTEFGLFAEVKDARITDCWIAVDSGNAARLRYEMPDGKGVAEGLRTRLDDLGIEEGAALRSLAARGAGRVPCAARGGGCASRKRRVLLWRHRRRHPYDNVASYHSIYRLYMAPTCRARRSGHWQKYFRAASLALCLAGEAQEGRTRRADLTRLTGWTQGCLTPIYVELRSFVGSSHFPQDSRDDHPWADHLLRYIEAEILGEAPNAYAPHLESALRSGNAVLILDGLDETPDLTLEGNLATRQQQLRSLSVSLETNFPATRIVVASRPYAYENWRWDDYHVVRIVPFDADRRTALAENLFRAARYNEPERQAEQFNRAMEDQRVAQALADNPLFITLIATLFVRSKTGQNLPTRKGALYRECVELLLQRWTPTKKGMPSLTQFLGSIQPQDLTARLAWLAFEVHSRSGSGQNGVAPEIPSELFGQFVSRIMKRDHAVDLHGLLSYLSDKAGLLISPGHRDDDYVFRFAHQTFQEYLAALHLICERCKTNYVPVREHITLQPDRWRIACLLVGDILRDKDSDDIALDDLWKLVHHLLEGDVPNSAMAKDDPHWWPVWLAASIVEEQTIYEPMPDDRVKRAIRASLVEWLMKLLETAEALPPQERSRCGRALGLLGDKRAGVGIGMHGLPDIVWGAPVLPGAYPVGGDERAFRSLPADTFPLSYSYRLSKYLVTNAQFQAFVDADAFRIQ